MEGRVLHTPCNRVQEKRAELVEILQDVHQLVDPCTHGDQRFLRVERHHGLVHPCAVRGVFWRSCILFAPNFFFSKRKACGRDSRSRQEAMASALRRDTQKESKASKLAPSFYEYAPDLQTISLIDYYKYFEGRMKWLNFLGITPFAVPCFHSSTPPHLRTRRRTTFSRLRWRISAAILSPPPHPLQGAIGTHSSPHFTRICRQRGKRAESNGFAGAGRPANRRNHALHPPLRTLLQRWEHTLLRQSGDAAVPCTSCLDDRHSKKVRPRQKVCAMNSHRHIQHSRGSKRAGANSLDNCCFIIWPFFSITFECTLLKPFISIKFIFAFLKKVDKFYFARLFYYQTVICNNVHISIIHFCVCGKM